MLQIWRVPASLPTFMSCAFHWYPKLCLQVSTSAWWEGVMRSSVILTTLRSDGEVECWGETVFSSTAPSSELAPFSGLRCEVWWSKRSSNAAFCWTAGNGGDVFLKVGEKKLLKIVKKNTSLSLRCSCVWNVFWLLFFFYLSETHHKKDCKVYWKWFIHTAFV